MKKFFAAIVLAVFALVGCDTGSSAGPNDDPAVESSSSSVIASSSVEQSSSSSEKVKPQSSSSEKFGKSSSSVIETSSSSEKLGSSSSVETPNSSSSELSEFSSSSADEMESSSSVVTLATPCKTETEDNCEYGTVLDDRDGQTYKTVKIGDQWWMAENLNYDPGQGGSEENPYDWSWCYGDDAANCTKYGRLYTWAAAMDSVGTWTTNGKGCGYNKTCSSTYPVRGVCPEGWHLPSTTEFETLFTAVGGVQDEDYAYRWNGAGTVLKSTGGWYNDGNGTDAFGFSALPAGYRYNDGYYGHEGSSAYFWSSTESLSNLAYYMFLIYNNDLAYLDYDGKSHGFSVRCLKD